MKNVFNIRQDRFQINRRWLLKASIIGAGLMVLGCDGRRTGDAAEVVELSPLIFFEKNGDAVIFCPRAEMGQDVYSSLSKILADEIGLDWARVTIRQAHHDEAFYSGVFKTQATGGSRSMRDWYLPLRELGARIRLAFLEAASVQIGRPVKELMLQQSVVMTRGGGRSLPISVLIDDVAKNTLPETAALKDDSELMLIGVDAPRKDILAKVTGTAKFGADIRLPGQLYAAVAMIPEMLGTAIVNNVEKAEAVEGVIGVYHLDNAVAVVAEKWAIANKAAGLIEVNAGESENRKFDDHMIAERLEASLNQETGVVAHRHGNFGGFPENGDKYLKVDYEAPYLAHACMETMTATASVTDDGALVIAPTQSPDRFAKVTAKLLDLPLEKVRVENTFLGGGFGRKGTDFQALLQAVRLSKILGRPVQVIWDRETDTRNDLFRPAAKFRYEAAMNDAGTIKAVRLKNAMPSIARQRFPEFLKPGSHELPEHLFSYDSEAAEHVWCEADIPIAVGFWRAVGNSNHPFASESFIDELAYMAGADPLEYRLRNLTKRPRAHAVLEAAAKAAGWGRSVEKGCGLGIAVGEAWDSACAQVAQVAMDGDEGVRVEKIWAAVDCGRIISPKNVRAQIESAILYALTAALYGVVNFEDGVAIQSNFHDYRALHMADAPEIEVVLLPSDNPPGGVGELGVPACAPAVANAIFAASGKRLRRLPLQL